MVCALFCVFVCVYAFVILFVSDGVVLIGSFLGCGFCACVCECVRIVLMCLRLLFAMYCVML